MNNLFDTSVSSPGGSTNVMPPLDALAATTILLNSVTLVLFGRGALPHLQPAERCASNRVWVVHTAASRAGLYVLAQRLENRLWTPQKTTL